MERPIEKHVTVVCGIPLIERFVYDYKAQPILPKPPEDNSSKQENGSLLNDLPQIKIVGSIVVLILAYCTFQYIAIIKCPGKLELDISKDSEQKCAAKLHEMEGALNGTKKQKDKLENDIAQYSASKNEFERKLREAEENLNSMKSELESTKLREHKLQTENANLKSEKESLGKELDATKHTLGNCKNTNMDHEVRSLELLQEIEGLKKELQEC